MELSDKVIAGMLGLSLLVAGSTACSKVPDTTSSKQVAKQSQTSYSSELLEIGPMIAQDYNLANIARDAQSYSRAYDSLMSTYGFSQDMLKQTNNDTYRATSVITLMQAAQTLLNAGNNIATGIPLGDQDRSKNIETAINHYNTALNLRKELDNHDNPFPSLNLPGRGTVDVATTSLIQQRIREAIGDYTQLTGHSYVLK